MIASQKLMQSVKRVVGYSPRALYRNNIESELSDMLTDRMLLAARRAFPGERVDVAIGNFGGIRCDLPQGEVTADDFISMFPFHSPLVLVKVKGSRLAEIFDSLASENLQPFSGATIVARKGVAEIVKVSGREIDPEEVYGIASVDFLLYGGDNLFLAKDALEILVADDIEVIDFIMEYVDSLGKAGAPITYRRDSRMTFMK